MQFNTHLWNRSFSFDNKKFQWLLPLKNFPRSRSSVYGIPNRLYKKRKSSNIYVNLTMSVETKRHILTWFVAWLKPSRHPSHHTSQQRKCSYSPMHQHSWTHTTSIPNLDSTSNSATRASTEKAVDKISDILYFSRKFPRIVSKEKKMFILKTKYQMSIIDSKKQRFTSSRLHLTLYWIDCILYYTT